MRRRERIENHIRRVREVLAPWAPFWAARFNGPVYLVGSTLHSPTPRDLDLRIIIDDHEFAPRYRMPWVQFDKPVERGGGVSQTHGVAWDGAAPSQAWIDEIAKFSASLARQLRAPVDFQVWPRSHWREPYPKPLLLAAPSARLFVYNRYAPAPKGAK